MRTPLTLLSAVLALWTWGAAGHNVEKHESAGKVMPPAAAREAKLPFEFGGPFELVYHGGVARRDGDFLGRFMLVFFGYTSCPNTCSTALVNVTLAIDEMGADAARFQPLLITVDPEFDTPERLADFVGRIHPRLIGLTGTRAQIEAAKRAYRVHAKPVADPGAFERLVDHSSFTYLIGPDGRFRTLLPPVLPADRVVEILRKYLALET